MSCPNRVLLISGKRKSGKDYIAEKLCALLDGKCCILRISEPIKSYYATTHNLSLEALMSDGPLKEKYRKSMTEWSEEQRFKDPGCFCEAACTKAEAKELWIVSDVRRKTDMEWFKKTYGEKIRSVRIETDLETRKDRGWNFVEGIDDTIGECGLDDYDSWDLMINNNSDDTLKANLQSLVKLIAI